MSERTQCLGIGQDGKRKLVVGALPGRKRQQLYFWDPMGIWTLATFKDDNAAEAAKRFLEGMIGARIVRDDAPPPNASVEPAGTGREP